MTSKRYWHALIIGIVGIIIFIILLQWNSAFSGFPVILIESSMGLGGWYLIDKYFLKGIDTADAIKKNNIALPIIFLAYSIIFAAAIIAN